MSPLVSVIIPSYNRKDFLIKCLDSVLKNNYQNFEIIVVDDNSTDGTAPFLKKKFGGISNLRVLILKTNSGPAKARNKGAKAARGEIFSFLDSDTEVDQNWIIEALRLFKKDREIGCLQCKLLLSKKGKEFDYAGEYLGQNGFLVSRAKYREIDQGQYDQEAEILAAKSAGMFIKKQVFQKIAGFDEDYFIYVEETDLGWRSWLAGHKTLFCPKSVVYHEFGVEKGLISKKRSSFNVRFHGTKNYICTLIKNLGFKNLFFILPRHLILWQGLILFFLFQGDLNQAANIGKGICWNLFNLKRTLKKRKRIQKKRLARDKDLFGPLLKKESLFKKIEQFLNSRKAFS